MKLHFLTFFITFFALLLSGCEVQTWRTKSEYVPPQGALEAGKDSNLLSAAESNWPATEYKTWCEPKIIKSKEEAKANIRNLLNSLNFESRSAADIDVDKYGMRAKLNWTETIDKQVRNDSYTNGFSFKNIFWGIRNFESTTTSYQTYQEAISKSKTVIIPFNEVFYISLGASADGEDKQNVYIYLKDGTVVNVWASNEYDSKLFVNSLYTLSLASFGNKLDNKMGILSLYDLSDNQKKQLNISN